MTAKLLRSDLTAIALLSLILPGASHTVVADQPATSATGQQEQPAGNSLQVTELIEPVIAPNLDLKEVAPLPLPVPATESVTKIHDPAFPDESAETDRAAEAADDEDKLVILGSEVEPGTATRLAWSTTGSIPGLATPTPVMVIKGKMPGKTMCMTAAVHGDELNGIEIVRRVMYDINPEKLTGTIIGVPIVNLQGFHRGSRYLSDRRDLNRFFPGEANGSMASRIAWSLFNEVIVHCDFLVDMHTGSLRRTNMPQIRADIRNEKVADLTEGFGKVVVIHSTGNPGMLRFATVDHGITAVTLEVGESLRIQEDQIEIGVSSINRLLEHQGMYSRLFTWGEPEPIYYKSRWIRAERGGILLSKKKQGDMVKVDEVLGTITDPITNETSDILSTANGIIIGMAVDQFVMPGYGCYHIGIEASEEVLAEQEPTADNESDVE
ncbi:MAG: succinylglutamate desuccinylase/aspartoacylase family protein [Gammaproteobacteria bacterium]|jgi:predicted deacylase